MVRYLKRPHIIYLHTLNLILSNFKLFPRKLNAPRIKTCIEKDNPKNLVYKAVSRILKENFQDTVCMEHLH